MKDKLSATKEKLKSIAATPVIVYIAGAVTGSAVTVAVVYYKTKHDYDNLLTLSFGREAFDALVNDETNFIRFWTGKHEHAFHVILEQ